MQTMKAFHMAKCSGLLPACFLHNISSFNLLRCCHRHDKLETPLSVIVRSMAGHSKWQNIRHIKAQKDSEKALTFLKHSQAIKRACLEGGGINPKMNSKLASAIEQAKNVNMPNASIDTVLKRAENKKLKEHRIEVGGPGGSYLILELECEQVPRAVHEIKNICRKKGGRLLEEGRTRMVFERKGIIRVAVDKDGQVMTAENALDDAILAGAEDVKESTDDEGKPQLEFVCSPEDFYKTKKQIEDAKYTLIDNNLEYIAVQKVSLSEDDMNNLAELCNALQEFPDVQKIYDNLE